MANSRVLRALGLSSLSILASLSFVDSAQGARCGAGGTPNSAGGCDCSAGYKSVGSGGSATCVPNVVVPIPGPGPGPGPAKACPFDAGSSVTIKTGTFSMGDVFMTGAGPVHSVTVADYQIDRYEVTAGDYKKCVDSGVCSAPPASAIIGMTACNWGNAANSCHPMNCVNYLEATTYCQWKGKRLPTEAEWEYSARGKTSTTYAWGADAPTCKHANFTETSGAAKANCGLSTSVVGTHAGGKSATGVHDLAGNVEEWVFDWYAGYSGKDCTNPGGPLTGTQRVAKGSAYDLLASDQKAARREGVDPTARQAWLGFRCAMGASPTATPACNAAPPPPPPPPTPAGPSDLGTMIKISGGMFKMGNALYTNSSPEHFVTLSPYSIDKYEVTTGQYQSCVSAGTCLPPMNSLSPYCMYGKPGKENHPISCVEWGDAKKYCAWAGKRLPTEAEWEYAARGTDGRTYPWGFAEPTCSYAAYATDEKAKTWCTGAAGGTSVVGTHPLGVSFFGAHDMGGNLSEWVFDYYAPYTVLPQTNPNGPYTGTQGHSARGGNWEIDKSAMRSYSRYYFDGARYWVGFRCARTGT